MLGRSSTTNILKVLARRKNERQSCVDEFLVDAYEVCRRNSIQIEKSHLQGWRQLNCVVEELRESHGLIDEADERSLKRWIRISRSHLEGLSVATSEITCNSFRRVPVRGLRRQ